MSQSQKIHPVAKYVDVLYHQKVVLSTCKCFYFASRSPIFIIVLFSRQFWLLWNPQSLSSEGNAVCCDSDEWCVLGDNFCASDHFKSVNVKWRWLHNSWPPNIIYNSKVRMKFKLKSNLLYFLVSSTYWIQNLNWKIAFYNEINIRVQNVCKVLFHISW